MPCAKEGSGLFSRLQLLHHFVVVSNEGDPQGFRCVAEQNSKVEAGATLEQAGAKFADAQALMHMRTAKAFNQGEDRILTEFPGTARQFAELLQNFRPDDECLFQ